MFKYLSIIGFLMMCFPVLGKTSFESLLTTEDLSYFPVQDQQIIKASFPELIKQDATKGANEVATIGPAGCNFNADARTTPIQDAIDWSLVTYTELRIVEGTYDEENITLDDRDMVIRGGYATCADAENGVLTSPDSLDTIIQSSSDSNPVFRIQGNTSSNNVIFHNLTIKNSGSSIWFGGAMRINDADVTMSINDVAMSNNTALRGGAVAVTGSSNNMILALNRVQINANTAEQGGGLYCNNPNAQITINASSGDNHGVYSNNATAGDGGGALIENGCALTTYQGTQDFNLFGSDYRGFVLNTATGNGGGLAVLSGSSATLYGRNTCTLFNFTWLCLFGNNTEPVNMFFNTADNDDSGDGDGGAIYVSGLGSEVLAENVYIGANFAVDGAGIAAENLATVTVKTAFENEAGSISCWQPDACVDFNNNLAESTGGGFYSSSGAVIDVANLRARNNRAGVGVVGYTRDAGSELNFESGLFYNNGDNGNGNYNDTYLFRAFQASELRVFYSTVTDNLVISRQFANNDAYIAMANSIIYDPTGVDIYSETGNSSPYPLRFADCLVVHEDQSFVAVTDHIVADPLFLDSGSNDYRLSDSSPAIDKCDEQLISASYPDLLGNTRGVDIPGIPNIDGPYDAGVYEDISSDIIFKHGFE